MTYVIGCLAGLILGGAVGYLKNLLLWKKYFREEGSADADANGVGDIYMRSLISFGVNVATLALAFFIRDFMPFNGVALLLGTAAGLVVMNKVLALGGKKRGAKEKEA